MSNPNENNVETKELTTSNSEARGELTFDNDVIKKIIGQALENVSGLLAVDGGFFSNLTDKLINTDNVTSGVNIEVGKEQVAVDLNIIVEYKKSVPEIFEEIKRVITTDINKMTGLEVVEVNVNVIDIKTKEQHEADSVSLQDRVSNVVESTGEFASDTFTSAKAGITDGFLTVKEKVGDATEVVVDKAVDVKDVVVNKAVDVKDAVVEKASDVKEATAEKVEEAKEVVSEAKEAVVEKASDVKEATADKVEEAKEVATDKAEDAKEATADKVEEAREVATEAKEAVVEKASDVKEATTDKVEEAKEVASDKADEGFAGKLFSKVKEAAEDAKDAVEDAYDGVKNMVKKDK